VHRRAQRGNNTRDGVAVSIGFYQFAEQLFDNFPGIGGGLGQFSSILRRLEITLVILTADATAN
jgi:hypothetical protein